MHFLRQVREQVRYVYQAIEVVIHVLTRYSIDIEAEVAENYKVAHSRKVGVATADIASPIPPKETPPRYL